MKTKKKEKEKEMMDEEYGKNTLGCLIAMTACAFLVALLITIIIVSA